MVTITSANVYVSNLTVIKSATTGDNGGIKYNNIAGLLYVDNVIGHDNRNGIWIRGMSITNAVIQNCIFYNNTAVDYYYSLTAVIFIISIILLMDQLIR